MPSDHFVPQHYLRHFSSDNKRIVAATLTPYRFLGQVPIEGQCQANNFYELNTTLNQMLWCSENDIAPVLVSVIHKKDFNLHEANALKLLAVIFHMRTRKAAECAKVFPKYMAKEFIQNAMRRGELPPLPEGNVLEEVIDFSGASGFLMSQMIPCWIETQTLDCKLVESAPGVEFITSDNPVSILNQFCVDMKSLHSSVGFSKAGFQLLMPISPNLCLICYDAKVYKLGNRRDRVVRISANDVEIVNALQIQTADTSIYWHDINLRSGIERIVGHYSGLRVPLTDILRVIPCTNANEELLHLTAPSVKLPKVWDFCRYRRHIFCKPGDRREPLWTQLAQDLTNDIEHNPNPDRDIYARMENIINQYELAARR